MPIEISNALRAPSVIRVEGVGTYYANLESLAVNANEVVSAASIKRITWSTNGNIQIVRGGVPIVMLHNTGTLEFDSLNTTLANNNTQPIVVTINTGGFVVLELTKEATYTTAPGGY